VLHAFLVSEICAFLEVSAGRLQGVHLLLYNASETTRGTL